MGLPFPPSSRAKSSPSCFGAVFLLWLVLLSCPSWGQPGGEDETVVLFPTDAYLDADRSHWVVPVHGWIFDLEQGSVWREFLIERLPWLLDVDAKTLDPAIYERRARLFLVDNDPDEVIRIELGGREYTMAPSAANGHFSGTVTVPVAQPDNADAGGPAPLLLAAAAEDPRAGAAPSGWLRFRAVVPTGAKPLSVPGRSHLVPFTGISVVSDIDDTIKLSNVADKQELLRNTFLEEFQPVPCIADVYGRWADQGAVFHYISGSPWQLYPPLAHFIEVAGLPQGAFYLKYVRFKDRTVLNLFIDPDEYKTPLVEALFERYPGRRFILVGDAGERDPEVYGEIARRYPDQVRHIFIRETDPGTAPDDARYRLAFTGVPPGRWSVFRDACSLKQLDPTQKR